MRLHLLALSCGLAALSTATAQRPLDWLTRSTTNPPSARNEWGAVYDSGRDCVVVFGGYLRQSTVTNAETWELRDWTWTRKVTANAPSARTQTAMAYDPITQQTLLFGGGFTPIYGDTWLYNGTNWTQLFPPTSPSARHEHAMEFDIARNQAVLFGGTNGIALFNDTWTFDFTTNTWTRKFPASSPPGRANMPMAYDTARARMVVFGGVNNNTTFGSTNDTWEWDGTTWTQAMPTTRPLARAEHALAYDVARQRTVLFGGITGVNPNFSFLGDTWEWNGTNWSQITPAHPPGAHWGMEMVYDLRRERTVRLGSQNVTTTVGLYGQIYGAAATSLGAGCTGTSGTPPQLFAAPPCIDTTTTLTTVGATPNTAYFLGLSLPTVAWNHGNCTVHVDQYNTSLTVGTTSQFGVAQNTLTIPNDRLLLGLPLHAQTFVLDGTGPLGGVATNGMRLKVGE